MDKLDVFVAKILSSETTFSISIKIFFFKSIRSTAA
jgi:hypothetical protein